MKKYNAEETEQKGPSDDEVISGLIKQKRELRKDVEKWDDENRRKRSRAWGAVKGWHHAKMRAKVGDYD